MPTFSAKFLRNVNHQYMMIKSRTITDLSKKSPLLVHEMRDAQQHLLQTRIPQGWCHLEGVYHNLQVILSTCRFVAFDKYPSLLLHKCSLGYQDGWRLPTPLSWSPQVELWGIWGPFWVKYQPGCWSQPPENCRTFSISELYTRWCGTNPSSRYTFLRIPGTDACHHFQSWPLLGCFLPDDVCMSVESCCEMSGRCSRYCETDPHKIKRGNLVSFQTVWWYTGSWCVRWFKFAYQKRARCIIIWSAFLPGNFLGGLLRRRCKKRCNSCLCNLVQLSFLEELLWSLRVVADCTLRRSGGGEIGRSVLDFLFCVLLGLAMTLRIYLKTDTWMFPGNVEASLMMRMILMSRDILLM